MITSMVDKYLATKLFEFNALSQFSIALFIYHVIYAKAETFKAKAKAKKFGLRAKCEGQGLASWRSTTFL